MKLEDYEGRWRFALMNGNMHLQEWIKCSEHSAVCAEHPSGDMILWTQCLLNRNLFTCCVASSNVSVLTESLRPFDKCHCLVFT